MHALKEHCNDFSHGNNLHISIAITAMNKELTMPPDNYCHHTVSNIWLDVLVDVSNASTVVELIGLKQWNLLVPLICLAVSNLFFSFESVLAMSVSEI